MLYNVSKLTSTAECNRAISLATQRKTDLLFQQTIFEKELTDQENDVRQTSIKLITVNALVTGTSAALATMPEGIGKINFTGKLRRLNDQKENLEERLENSGAAALLDGELYVGLVQTQIAEIDGYIAAIEARKAEF